MDLLRSFLTSTPSTTLPLHEKEDVYSAPRTQDFHYDVSPIDALAVLREINNNRNGGLSAGVQAIGGMTLEEDLAEHTALAASAAYTRLPVSSSPAKISRSVRQTSSAIPIPQGPRSAEATKTLYHLCQKRAIIPQFTFEQIGEHHHQAILQLGDVLLKDEQGRKFSSKKEAKEVMAAKGVEIVKGWIEAEPSVKEPSEKMSEAGCVRGKRDVDAMVGRINSIWRERYEMDLGSLASTRRHCAWFGLGRRSSMLRRALCSAWCGVEVQLRDALLARYFGAEEAHEDDDDYAITIYRYTRLR
jgi:hypothetical protein